MACFLTATGSYLPGAPVGNAEIQTRLGRLWGESRVRRQVLAANGITTRYYAQDDRQHPTHDVYDLALEAIRACLGDSESSTEITYLSAGSTNSPYIGPGLGSVLHGRLAEKELLSGPIEINSNSGICSSSAQAFVNACRAIETGDHRSALCVGTEHASEVLKSRNVRPEYDWAQMLRDMKRSKWFMTVFLRFMLSDGAGAVRLDHEPVPGRVNYRVDWTYSESFAGETPLCMSLDNKRLRLRQDIRILSENLGPCARQFVRHAFERHQANAAEYDVVLPHISSKIFTRELKSVMRQELKGSDKKLDYWTNLATAGNTGAASAFVMLDEYTRTQEPHPGQRLLVFVPESGWFNFVLVSLTVV